MKTVLIAGGTGLIGGHVVAELAKHKDIQIIALLRRPVDHLPSNVKQVVVDFERGVQGLEQAVGTIKLNAPVCLICAIGTTMRAAGSKEAFTKVDRDIPLLLLKYSESLAAMPKFIFVSSLGADHPYGFYLETKHAVEKEILKSNLPYVIARPSLLVGERSEKRLGEQIAQNLMPGFFNLLAATPLNNTQWFKRYRPVPALAVGARLAAEVLSENSSPHVILEGDDLRR